jgi:Domain of unknown function (DUF4389)
MASYQAPIAPYPVHVEGHLERPSRWLWLVKWLLAIPHYIVLVFLWLAFFVCAIAAFAGMLFTGRYPRSLFEFNVGVMRWSWRVAFYAYGANGTDRYPPFTLADVPDYPARLEVEYPQHQRRGLPLVGWWLAGIPQYLIAGIFAGGGLLGWTADTHSWGRYWGFGLIGLVVLVALIVLLFRGFYPRQIFDFVLGLNRWAMRVLAYAALMTPEYPPFRLDPGEQEPGGLLTVPAVAPQSDATAAARVERQSASAERSWSAGRVIAVVAGSLVSLLAAALIAASATALIFDQTQRDAAGYLMTDSESYSTSGYALVSDTYTGGTAADLSLGRDILGTVRILAGSDRRTFVGIARASAANAYLAGVARSEATHFGQPSSEFTMHAGGAPGTRPAVQRFWVASTAGSGSQTLTWKPTGGSWRIVVMNANASRGVQTQLSVGAQFPHLLTISLVALGIGLVVLLVGGSGLYFALRRSGPEPRSMDGQSPR